MTQTKDLPLTEAFPDLSSLLPLWLCKTKIMKD